MSSNQNRRFLIRKIERRAFYQYKELLFKNGLALFANDKKQSHINSKHGE